MHKPNHVFLKITEEYRKLREIQTFINRFVWSSELCYSYFLNIFENKKEIWDVSTLELFHDLPIQAWFKNKDGTGKYALSLNDHNTIVKSNQYSIFRSAIILYNSYFDNYLKYRADSRFALCRNLTNINFERSKIKINIKNLFKADICREIRNLIVHEPVDTFLSITDIRGRARKTIEKHLNKVIKGKKSFLLSEYSEDEIKDNLDKAMNEVFDMARVEVGRAFNRGATLPHEFFFMLYTFTNYNTIAAEIEQILFDDDIPKTFYNRVNRSSVNEFTQHMVVEPAIAGRIYNLENNKPVESVIVSAQGTTYFGVSDKFGQYYLTPNLREGIYTIETKCKNYEPSYIEVNTIVDKTIVVDIGVLPRT